VSTSAVPALIDALFAAAVAALPSTLVFDGYGNTDDPGDFLMIGVEDPDSRDHARSATAEQDWANATYTARDESGEVTCAALSWNGDANQKAARDAVYAISAAVENLLRANPSLGVASLLWTSFGPHSDLQQLQDEQGALALLTFSIRFRARL
jgi:hypothetical protein